MTLVSIVVRTCDRPGLLRKALHSISAQTWEEFEIVLVNDGKHSVAPVIDQLEIFPKINLVEHSSSLGRSAAANTGLKNCSGGYLCFLDDDDMLLPSHIETLATELNQNRSVDVAYTGVQCIDDADKFIPHVFCDSFDSVRLRAGNFIPFNAVMFRRRLLEKGVKVDESLDLYEDWDFLLQLLEYSDFTFIDQKTALYRISQTSGFGVTGDPVQVNHAHRKVLNKWRNKWSLDTIKEMANRSWQFTMMKNQLKGHQDRELSYQEQLKGYHERELSYQEQLKGYHNRESFYQQRLKEYEKVKKSYQALCRDFEEKSKFVDTLLSSYSWRMTAPLRAANFWIKKNRMTGLIYRLFRRLGTSDIFSPAVSERVQNKLYRYQLMQKPVPKLKKGIPHSNQVTIVAFYLPQFHAIPENDRWWGKGFTEWTNVRPATPQFDGHYQPHVPGELGYYDLTDKSVMKKQIALAKKYGIGGFCFYFYWFAGKRLLESPLLAYLEDDTLGFSFCLAWANENWSRRWDGLEHDILIRQAHSPEDDFNFIHYVARYLTDRRYIRIDNKPLLIVYRPNLLPSPRETTGRWRRWCREHGIGEIYLAYTQGFEKMDPVEYGFDAAIEFPPNNSCPPNITKTMVKKRTGFKGTIYDWRALVERSFVYAPPEYPLFRGVNPSWDNTARKKQNSIVFAYSSPFGYLLWLLNALQESIFRTSNKDERLVFVNAWNEWAEGAHLEPDKKYGYGFLEATRMALCRSDLLRSNTHSAITPLNGSVDPTAGRVAIIIHAFYLDVFQELVEKIKMINVDYKLFVTTPHENKEKIQTLLAQCSIPHHVQGVENHGRDVLPFLKIIHLVVEQGFSYFLKIHTKKSTHRKDGDVWRNDLYAKLLDPEKLAVMVKISDADQRIGLIGPGGHMVSMTTYLGSNRDRIKWYAERMGLSMYEVLEIPFVAGTMFFARITAVFPLLCLSIDDTDFESEKGQVDGTLAHSVERLFSISTVAAGMKIVDTDYVQDPATAIHVNDDYAFV